jgi:hypothetical protein
MEPPDEQNALLEEIKQMVSDFLGQEGYALRGPVEARFRKQSKLGSEGIDVMVQLEDRSLATTVRAALAGRFPDRLSEVTVS